MSNLDEAIFRVLNQAGSSFILDVAMVALTVVGFTYVIVLASVPLWLRGRRDAAFDLVIAVLIASALAELLKLIIDRSRPLDILSEVNRASFGWLSKASGPSFPSGHAARAFAASVVILLASRRWCGVTAVAVAALIGVSRIYLGLHWPSDVFAGALLGTAVALFVAGMAKTSSAYISLRAWFTLSVKPSRSKIRTQLQ